MRTAERHETYVDQHPETGATERHLATSPRAPWSPVQPVVLLIGLLFIVVGAVALIRTGIDLNRWPGQIAHPWGLGFTSVSALCVLAAGIVLALSAAAAVTARTAAWCVGMLDVAFGVIVALSPRTFSRWWGFDSKEGVALAVFGGALLLAAAISPTFVSRTRSTTAIERDATSSPSSTGSAR